MVDFPLNILYVYSFILNGSFYASLFASNNILNLFMLDKNNIKVYIYMYFISLMNVLIFKSYKLVTYWYR